MLITFYINCLQIQINLLSFVHQTKTKTMKKALYVEWGSGSQFMMLSEASYISRMAQELGPLKVKCVELTKEQYKAFLG